MDEKELLNDGTTKSLGIEELANKAMDRAIYIIANVRKFKQARLDRIAMYRDLYAGNTKKKYRQAFNVVLPVFAGAMDTLQAAFNDDLSMQFLEQEKADYMSAKKITALWDQEVGSTAPNAKFALKCRWDRANALMSGRGFMMNYGQSNPHYCNNFEIFELDQAIFQPMGGGHLESHLYAGREDIIRSRSQLETGSYDQAQVKKLIDISAKTDYYPEDFNDTAKVNLAKFKASGLSPSDANYVGEQLFNLVEIVITMDGKRWYLVFSPWYRIWLRFCPNIEMSSMDLYPYISWATHEDNKNFLSKSYADDMYSVADGVHTLFNQELTNREKKNFRARAFDPTMFPNVAALDNAQHRPDALVAFDSKGGTRKASDGIFTFEVGELNGTIDLIEFMDGVTGRSVGVTDLSMGGVQNVSKKATVVFAEQANISKRLLLRSSPYTEAMAEVGKLFIQSCKDHMPAKRAIKLLGDEGVGFDSEITRMDLDTYADLNIKIISSSLEMRNSQLKKEARMKTYAEIMADPKESQFVNPRVIVEEKLRSGAEHDDAEIALIMDTKNYGNKEEASYAHLGIQQIIDGEQPQLYYGATNIFLTIIYDYARNHKSKIGNKKYEQLLDYMSAHDEIVQENIERKAQDERRAMMSAQMDPTAVGATPAQDTPPPQNDATGLIKQAMSTARKEITPGGTR